MTVSSTTAQIYYHNFGTTTISAHPYTVAPTTLNTNLSGSSWSNSLNTWTSTAGATGEAIRLTTSTNATITLTFNVAANYQVNVTSFDFWRQRSNFGPQNWSMTINGINVGSGTVDATGGAIGTTNVANTVSGLTGTVTVVISLTGSTGNGTLRLDDFTLNGSVTSNCVAPTITSFTPTSGPQNTLVTINGSGFTNGSGTSAVKFNGIPSTSFTVVSNTVIKAYVPAGNASAGPISITTNGCEGFSAGNFTKISTTSVGNYSSDIYISELYDAQAGDGGIIEIYNGTASTVNLAGYTIRRYGDIGGTTFYTIVLSGSIPPGGIFLIGIGTGTIPCGITSNQTYPTGFNANDEFQLLKNGVLIDNVHAPNNVGYSVIRNPNAVAPKPVFNGSDWNTLTTESCANIGIHNVTNPVPPTLSNPTSRVICENNTVTYTASLANSTGFTFQWKRLDTAGNWINITNTAPFSGANTNTLTITPAPLTLDDSQYYCQVTSTQHTLISNAAQLKVNPSTIPDFPTSLAYCTGATIPALSTTSPNGVTGTWSPATISNTTSGSYVFTPTAGLCSPSVTLNVTISNSITPDFATAFTLCSGATAPVLNIASPNGITGTWSPATVSNMTSGSYVFTPNAGQCATNVTFNVTVTNTISPDFPTTLTLCNGATVPTLNTTSPNGIAGTWSPATISNTTSGSYVFTPNAGQCAVTTTLNVTVNNNITPDFPTALAFCNGATIPALQATSPNGISGTWSPATISNTASGSYVFTPNAGQCATTATLNVTIDTNLTPDFPTALAFCNGATVPVLQATSPNGITGTWSPATISNTASGSYVFTPNAGQCATNVTLNVTINNNITPDFPTTLAFCNGATVPALQATSPNGITGTWSPATISNTASGSYVFTPTAGQCATTATLNVTINNNITPDFPTALNYCNGATVPVLQATSPNGITGTWSPATISNTASGSYVFTPNAGQCATTATLNVTINNNITPDFPTTLNYCSGATIPALQATSPNGITGTWSPATISNTASGSYVFTPNAGQCATTATLNVTINNNITPDFPTTLAFCNGATVPALQATSPNGITGTWSPATISNTASGSYVFTPNAGQCATTATLNVTINNNITPDFPTALAFCNGATIPALQATSPNGITGTWSPATISNTASGSYVFTPNAGQCAVTTTLNVTINNNITPDFPTALAFCSGATIPALQATSPNGITGTWSPATISNTASGSYVFTPNAGQCATTATLNVTINNNITPDFPTTLAFCNGATVPALQATSPNGITGTWSPATISNTASGSYVFTPNAGQCAVTTTLNVTINNNITPDFPTALTFCNGATVPTLQATSPNGITGTWSPATISNTASGSYVFTPNAGQCAVTTTLNVTINNIITPDFPTALNYCSGATIPALQATSPNGITGTWSPATISNTASGSYVFTPNAGQCGTTATLNVTINNNITPDFPTALAFCNGATVPALQATSPNGITGTWNPATISNTTSRSYVFTPNAGQCATTATLNVTINNNITPNFPTALAFCNGATVPALQATSPNGITGTWSPATISNTASGSYVFTPNAGQCATTATLNVTINNVITPNFPTALNYCSGATIPALQATSPNGITGTWSPATISSTASGSYVFTPNAGQCATTATLNVTINNNITPDFPTTLTFCNGETVPALQATSPNGITGTWSPATISNTASGNYVFTPSAGQCATTMTLRVTITPRIVPSFQTAMTICNGSTAPVLNTTSPNGITGTWSPATISNTTSGNYVFTPNTGQCAATVTLTVTVTNIILPDFPTALTFCNGDTVPALQRTSPNGISGTWSPATISNTASGSYVFTPNAGQCATNMTLTVTINSFVLPAITGPGSVCISNSIQLTHSTPGGTWSSNNTNIATVDAAGNVTGISAGSVMIIYTANNGTCTASVRKPITVTSPPKPVLKDGFICLDNQTGAFISTVNLYCQIPNANHSFVWTRNNAVLPTTTNTHVATEPGTYEVVVTNLVTGCTATATATVGTSSIAIAEATVGRDFNKNQIITINVTGGSGQYEFQLNGGAPQTSNQFTNIYEGEYEITVRDTQGCGFITLTVYALNYPYYFTPNADGYNDTWNIDGLSNQPEATIYIFDRYGKLIKQIFPSSAGWDGTYNGHPLPATDYWFKLLYKSRDGVNKEFKAHFALKR